MEERGPFDRLLRSEPASQRDRAATIIVAVSVILGIVLLILVLPPVSIFRDRGSSAPTGPVTAKARSDLPPLPARYEAVSGFFDLVSEKPVHSPARLTLTLTVSARAGETLALLSYEGGQWVKVGDAQPVAGGSAARAEVPALPSNVLVAREATQTKVAVLGALSPGAELDPQALDALTELSPGGFFPASDGSVGGAGPSLPAGLSVPVVPTIGATDPAQVEAVNTILASADLRAAHVQAIAGFLRNASYAGVILDYRGMDAARGGDFVSFVRDLSTALRADSRTLTLTLPAPVRNGSSWNTAGFDWQALAPLVDAFQIAAETEQDVYYARMADALGYLTPIVGGGKLLLTVGPLSHDRGPDGVRSLSLTEALTVASVPALRPAGSPAPGATVQAIGANLVSDNGASALRWDDTAHAVTFTYTGTGGVHTVWLADLFSEAFKLDLAHRYHLRGVAVQDVSKGGADANIWPALRQYAKQGQVTLAKPNGTLLQPHWEASAGSFAAAAGAAVTWHAPNATGAYTLTIVVSDGVLRVAQQLSVTVEGSATAPASP